MVLLTLQDVHIVDNDVEEKCGDRRFISHLQLFDGLSFLADDQANLVGGDEDLLDGAVAVHVAVEAGTVAALLHDLVQQPLGLPVGRRQVAFVSTDAAQTSFISSMSIRD